MTTTTHADSPEQVSHFQATPIIPALVQERRLSAESRPALLCFSHLRWDFVWQRPQHLMSRAAADYDVLFVEEPIVSDVTAPNLVVRLVDSGVKVAHLAVPAGTTAQQASDALRRFLHRFVPPSGDLVLWFYTPMALPSAEGLPAVATVYDCMDDLKSFAGAPREMVGMESRLLQQATVVLTGGRSLFQSRNSRHGNVHLFPSSIDTAHFAKARQTGREPEDQKSLALPRIGFFGVIDERMDLGLVRDIAERRPDWQLVMLGPTAKIDPASLPRLPNIHWLGMKSYAELPDYLRGWQAGFMPFAQNDATRFISPTKTPEFLGAGIPLVSTPIADVLAGYEGLVHFASTSEGFVEALVMAMGTTKDQWQQEVDAILARGSWDRTWADIARLIVPVRTGIHSYV